jgi:hypothetical protein
MMPTTDPDAPRLVKSIWPERHVRALAISLATLTAIGFTGWGWFLESAIQMPADGAINVVSASWAENCGAPKDNVLQWVRSACSGKRKCNFIFDWRMLGNPAPACAKHLDVEWKCSLGGQIFHYSPSSDADPAQGTILPLSCM